MCLCMYGKETENGQKQMRAFHLSLIPSLFFPHFKIERGNKQFINIICSSVSLFSRNISYRRRYHSRTNTGSMDSNRTDNVFAEWQIHSNRFDSQFMSFFFFVSFRRMPCDPLSLLTHFFLAVAFHYKSVCVCVCVQLLALY